MKRTILHFHPSILGETRNHGLRVNLGILNLHLPAEVAFIVNRMTRPFRAPSNIKKAPDDVARGKNVKDPKKTKKKTAKPDFVLSSIFVSNPIAQDETEPDPYIGHHLSKAPRGPERSVRL